MPHGREAASREILVFVSSPSDRGAERSAVRDAITRVNGRLAALGHRRTMAPVMWEDLPPGEAPDGDFQALIDKLLERFERDRYGVYLGFIGAHLGTPTPRYASGTVEEFEESLARRRRTGRPEQVLFYFIDPDALQSEKVAVFRTELGKRGYLYQSATAAAFPARIEEALFTLAAHWDDWPPTLRRTGRRAVLPTVSIVGVSLLALIAWILVVSIEARRLLATGPAETCRYLVQRPLPFDPLGVVAALDARFKTAIGVGLDGVDGAAARERIGLYDAWSHCPTADHALRPSFVAPLRAAVERTVHSVALSPAGHLGLDLDILREARDAGLFAEAPDRAIGLSRLVASRRLFDRQVAPGEDPFERLAALSAAERSAVAVFAKAAWAVDGWRDRRRRALAAASDDVDIIASALWGAVDDFDQSQRRFVHAAAAVLPEDRLLTDFARMAPLPADAGTPKLLFTEALIEGVLQRRPVLFGLLRLLARGPLPGELNDLIDRIARDGRRPGDDAAFIESLMQQPGAPPPIRVAALSALVTKTYPNDAVACRYSRWATELLPVGPEVAFAMYGTIRSPCAAPEPFVERVDDHVAGRIGFGFGERVRILEALSDAFKIAGLADKARAIVRRTLDEHRSLVESRTPYPLSPEAVENAWLQGFETRRPDDADADLIARIVERRAKEGRSGDVGPLGIALRELPEPTVLKLLNVPRPPLLDPPFSDAWPARVLVVRSLAEKMPRDRMPAVGAAILASRPVDEEMAESLLLLAARGWPSAGLPALVARASANDPKPLKMLGRLLAFDTLRKLLPRLPREQPARRAWIGAVLEGICSDDRCDCAADCAWMLPQKEAAAFIAALAEAAPETLGPDPRLFGKLLGAARRLGLRQHPALDAAVARPLPDPAPPALLVALARYLGDAESLLRVFGRPDSALMLDAALRRADDADWIFVVQEFYPVAGTNLPPSLEGAALARASAISMADEKPPDFSFAVNGRWLLNPLLIALANARDDSGRIVEELREFGQREPELLGLSADVVQIYQGYLTWLLARHAQARGGACMPALADPLVGLDDGHAAIVLGRASLVIAATTNVLIPSCR